MGRGGEAGAGPIGPLMLVCGLECDVVMGSHWEISSKAGAEAGLSKAPWWPCAGVLGDRRQDPHRAAGGLQQLRDRER